MAFFGGFGQPAAAAPAPQGGFAFGGAPAAPAAPAFGGFGQPAAAPAFGAFGAPAAPAFGAAPAAPAFGAAAPAAAEQPDAAISLPSGADSLSSVAFSPSSQFLSVASWDSKVYLWELSRGANGAPSGAAQKMVSPDLGAPILDHKWAPDGSSVFAVGCGKVVKHWSLQTNTVQDIGSHDAPIKSVHWCSTRNLLVTGAWDKTLRYWDCRQPNPVAKVDLPERVLAMDVLGNVMVLCTADLKVHLFDLNANPAAPVRSLATPLKLQTRAVRVFHDSKFFALASIEGRCAIRSIDPALDVQNDAQGRPFNFAFRCHRDAQNIYPIHAIDTNPAPEFHSVFATTGSDGAVTLWDREKRQKLKELKCASKQPVTDVRWNAGGDLMAYTGSYDWARGPEGYNLAANPPVLYLRHTTPEKDLRVQPAAKK